MTLPHSPIGLTPASVRSLVPPPAVSVRPAARTALALVALAAGLAGCGGSADTVPAPPPVASPAPPPAPQALDCSALVFAASRARPLSELRVSGNTALGIDASWAVEVRAASGRSVSTGFTPNTDGSLNLVAPLHPDLTLAGGAVDLVLRQGERQCAPLAFTVQSLPAPTDRAYVQGTVTRVRELGAQLQAKTAPGLDAGALLNTSLAELPVTSVPAALAATVLQQLEPLTDAVQALPEAERDTVVALFAQTGINTLLDRLAQGLNSLPTSLTASARPRRTVMQAPAHASAGLPAVLTLPGLPALDERRRRLNAGAGLCGSLGAVPADLFDIADANDLSRAMQAGAKLKEDLDGPLSTTFRTLSGLFSALRLVSPPVSRFGGGVLFVAEIAAKARVNLYPNSLTGLEFNVDRPVIEEDWSRLIYGDPIIRWSGARLRATNSGMSLVSPAIQDVLNLAGEPEGFNPVLPPTQGADFAGKTEVGQRLAQLPRQEGQSADCWTVGTTHFGPYTVPDDDHFKLLESQANGEAVLVDVATREIMGNRLGTGQVELRSRAAAFPGPIVVARRDVRVAAKSVRFLPSAINRIEQPGEEAEVRWRMDTTKHAEVSDVQVEVSDRDGRSLAYTGHQASSNQHSLRVTTPTQRERFPLTVTVTSTSLALDPQEPPRRGTQSIVLDGGLEIDPQSLCMARGEQQRFTATWTGEGDTPAVRWQLLAGGGSLSATSGLVTDYQAPNSDGRVRLRVSLEEDDLIQDEIEFQVGRCVGMAVYYQHAALVNFPGSDPGCATSDQGEFVRLDETLSTVPPELDQRTPFADLWFGRESGVGFDPVPTGTAIRGLGPTDACVNESFRGRATLVSRLVVNDAGDRLDIDILGTADNECRLSATGEACSSASADTQFLARTEVLVRAASRYRLQLVLDCSRTLPNPIQPFNVSLTVLRFAPDGSPLLTHRDFSKAFVPGVRNTLCQSPETALRFDQVLEFDAPLRAGDEDRVVIQVVAAEGARTSTTDASGGPGLIDTGSMRGFLQVTPVP